MKVSYLKKVFVIGIFLVVSLTMTTGVFADTQTNEVDITVESGEFSVQTSIIESFGEITLEESDRIHTTSFDNNFTVKDLRGTQEGWRLDVSANRFENEDNHQLPAGSLALKPIDSIVRDGAGSGDSPTVSMNSNEVIDNGTVEVASAAVGAGMGVFDITFPNEALVLTVDPTTAKVGEYTSTLTWNLVAAP